MRHRTALPEALGTQFTVADAREHGVGRGRSAARDLARPFHAVRARRAPTTPLQRVQNLVPRLRPGQLVGSSTALHVWGLPYPVAWTTLEDVVVVVPTDAVRPRTPGVKGLRLARGRARGWRVAGIPVVDPTAALFMCAGDLTDDQIVILLDALITTADNYPGLRKGRPISTVAAIEQRLRDWGRFPCCGRVRSALDSAREGVESPKETETRLVIVAAGLPEPAVQHSVFDSGRFVARVDLGYPELRIAIEYEGDGHRTSRDQWRKDIQRQRDLEDLGWIVIRVTELDLQDGGAALLRRIRNAIASR
ncbi:endonuclease domain-containing protein [Microbacterium sp. SD291]|uniref:endonuclease domain-containing protein n=1 Tax=Microbacterium sp. SD291 TaxID=2782007 RepID=UPI001A9568D0|nr:hypothetical protein [Microbacterium sp. SD291]MBO0979737.1 hypothetical protein [Microbacterium sp. SD291]